MSDNEIAHDQEPAETLVLLQRTQDVVDTVLARFRGQTDVHPTEVERVLSEQIALAGLPEQPAPWIRNTAIEIADGRTVVIDTRTAGPGHPSRPE
jgi:hypothetical protein